MTMTEQLKEKYKEIQRLTKTVDKLRIEAGRLHYENAALKKRCMEHGIRIDFPKPTRLVGS